MGWKDYKANMPVSGQEQRRQVRGGTGYQRSGEANWKGREKKAGATQGKVYTLRVVGVEPKENKVIIQKKDGKKIGFSVEEWKERKYDISALEGWLKEGRRVYVKMDIKNKVVVRAFSSAPEKMVMREPSPKYNEPKRAEELFLNNMRESIAMLKNVGYDERMIKDRMERVMREMGYVPLVVLTKERIEEELGRKVNNEEFSAIAGAIENEYMNSSVVDEAVGEVISSAIEKVEREEGEMEMEVGD